MRRLSPALWIGAPLLVGLAYAGAHAVLAPSPTLENVVPQAAVLTARFRGLAALDELWFLPRPGEGRPAEFLAAQRNLPGLAGVAASGPIHYVLLPALGRPDPSLLILPVEDADALEARFLGRDLPEAAARGLERHPHQLEVRGDFAALAWDREIVRHLGEGGVTLADRGEDLGLAVDVPGALSLMLALGHEEPWRPILEALGARPAQLTWSVNAATGVRRPGYPAGRTPRVGAAWRTARLWAYRSRGAVEIELEPADPSLRALLAAVASEPAQPVHGRQGAAAVLEIPSGAARRSLHAVLEAAGFALPAPGAAAPAAGEGAGLAVSAYPDQGAANSWTLDVEAFGGALPDLSGLLGPVPAPGASSAYAAGALPAMLFDRHGATVAPAGRVVRPTSPAARLLVGLEAESAAASLPPPAAPLALAIAPGEALIARLSLSPRAAAGLLGSALTRGGLLHVLAGGPLAALLSTDGKVFKALIVRTAR